MAKVPEQLEPYWDQVSEKMGALDDRSRYAIFAGILILFFVADYFLFMNPQLSALRKISPEIKLSHDEIEKIKNDYQRLPQFRTNIEDLKKKEQQFESKIRGKGEIPLVLEMISQKAIESNIKIEQIMPKTDDQEVILENKDRKYWSVPVYIQAVAGYHDLGRFLNNLEAGEIFLNVNSLTVSALPDSRMNAIKLTLMAVVSEAVKK